MNGLPFEYSRRVEAPADDDRDRELEDFLAQLDAKVLELANQACPVGTVRATVSDVADTGWLLDAQTIVGADVLYPQLWAKVPAGWKSGTSLVIPNAADARLRGHGTRALGTVLGSDSLTLTTAQLPSHVHSVDPPDTAVSFGTTIRASTQTWASGSSSYVTAGGTGTIVTASVNIAAFNSAPIGSGSAVDITGKTFAVRFQVKHDYV